MPPVFQGTRSAIFTTTPPLVYSCPWLFSAPCLWSTFHNECHSDKCLVRRGFSAFLCSIINCPWLSFSPKPLSCVTKWAGEQFLLPEASKKWSEADHKTTIISTNTNTGQRSSLGSGWCTPNPPHLSDQRAPQSPWSIEDQQPGYLNGRRRKRHWRSSVLKLNHSAAGKL